MQISSEYFGFELQYARLIELMIDSILVSDINGQLIDANPPAFNVLGFARENIPILKLVDLLNTHENWGFHATSADRHSNDGSDT